MHAQNAARSAGITGRIVDLQSGTPIRDARIALLGTAVRAATDSTGHFAVESLRSGTYVLQARAIGYTVTSWVIPVQDGELVEKAFELPPIVDTLAAVTVRFALHKSPAVRTRFPSYETPERPGRRSFATTGIPVEAAAKSARHTACSSRRPTSAR